MIIRFGAAVLFVGLSFASPSSAETLLQESGFSLDLREGETQPLDVAMQASVNVATVFDEQAVQLPAVELPGRLAGLVPPEVQDEPPLQLAESVGSPTMTLADRDGSEDFTWMTADLANIGEALDESIGSRAISLADRDGSEDFTWMTADLANIGDMTTGSIGNSPSAPVTQASESAALPMTGPQSDDAFPIE